MIRKAADCTSLHIICRSVAVRKEAHEAELQVFCRIWARGLLKMSKAVYAFFHEKIMIEKSWEKKIFFRECRSFTIVMVFFIVYTICGNCLRKQLPSQKPPLRTTESFEDNLNKLAYRYIQLRGRNGFIRISIEWPPTFQLCYVPGAWK